MDNDNQNKENKSEVFRYTYSSQEHKEAERIRRQYLPQEESKLEQLQKLDRRAKLPGTIAALALGIVSTLTIGFGMSLVMVWDYLLLGVSIGLLGLVGVCLNYPLFLKINKRQKEKYAPEILLLSNEITSRK